MTEVKIKPLASAYEHAAKIAEEDHTPGYGPHKDAMEWLAETQRREIARRIREAGERASVYSDTAATSKDVKGPWKRELVDGRVAWVAVYTTDLGNKLEFEHATEDGAREWMAIVSGSTTPPVSDREENRWREMDSAPLDGKHCILAVKSGAFIYSVQGAYRRGQWDCACGDNVKPLYWMPNVLLPEGWEGKLAEIDALQKEGK